MTEYRIDDLARAAGTTTRNVRGYQDRGLLPRPAKRGRVAIYSDVHLSRLTLINNLLGRGFTARHIADFITGMQRGDNLAQVLGVDEILAERWSTAESEVVSDATLASMLGTADPAIHATMTRIGLIERTESGDEWTLLDRDTVHGIADLISLGLSLTSMLDVFARMASSMDAAANTLITAARDEFESRQGQGWVPRGGEESEWAATLMTQMRQTATKAAHNALNRALDRTLAVELDDYLGR